jgi:hypothetical protein
MPVKCKEIHLAPFTVTITAAQLDGEFSTESGGVLIDE